jgi:hypothetical protein
VRDPAFKPVIDGAVADPSAGLDPGALAGVQARAPAILSDCTASRSA